MKLTYTYLGKSFKTKQNKQKKNLAGKLKVLRTDSTPTNLVKYQVDFALRQGEILFFSQKDHIY